MTVGVCGERRRRGNEDEVKGRARKEGEGEGALGRVFPPKQRLIRPFGAGSKIFGPTTTSGRMRESFGPRSVICRYVNNKYQSDSPMRLQLNNIPILFITIVDYLAKQEIKPFNS